MKKENIVQYVSFLTNLSFEDFGEAWEQFARKFGKTATSINLYEAIKKPKNRSRFISTLECGTEDFRFAFMKGRTSENFPEHNVKVVQMGGYIPVHSEHSSNLPRNTVKVMAFFNDRNYDWEFCKQLKYTYLNVFEAYYENCAYSYIAEFICTEEQATVLTQALEEKGDVWAASYKLCPAHILH